MLSPATPLTIALLVAFVLLLLTCLSTPVIKSIPLGSSQGIDYGVLGWCTSDGSKCSSPQVGYTPIHLSSSTLSTNSRTKLTFILIVHPIAAFLVLVCTILAGAAHAPAAGHSPQYLLALLILTFPTLLVTLLAFLVDILLFIPPRMQWGGWIVLPAVLIITACSVVTCAMRRTLSSRLARKERIEKNEDMNGSAYYQMKQDTSFSAPEPTFRAPETQYRAPDTQLARAESPPPLGTVSDSEKTAQFASYDNNGSEARERSRSRPRRPGEIAGVAMAENGAIRQDNLYDDSGAPRRSSESRSRRPRGQIPPYGRGGYPSQGYGPGRGGYPPPPRGGRGGYYPPRGAYGPGGRGPPPGWTGYSRGGPMGRGRPGPPPGYPNGYGRGPPPPPAMGPGGVIMYPNSRSRSNSGVASARGRGAGPWPDQEQDYSQQEGGDWETAAYHESQNMPGTDYVNDYGERDMPADNSVPAYDTRPSTGGSITRDPSSFGFSGRQPSPARSQGTPRSPSPPPPLPSFPHDAVGPGQAVELGSHTGSRAMTPTGQPQEWDPNPQPRQTTRDTQASKSSVSSHNRPRVSSDNYYEDMDPRFSEDADHPLPVGIATIITAPDSHLPPDHAQQTDHALPTTLMPGYTQEPSPMEDTHVLQSQDPNTLYPAGPDSRDPSRSPAPSDEGSNFTSISQRGVNPQWQPGHGWTGSNIGSYGPPKWREQEHILNNNPDFVVPGAGPGRNRGGSASGAMTTTSRGHARGLSAGGRYPDPV